MVTRIFSPDVTVVEDAETEIKQMVRKGYLHGLPRAEIERKARKIARAAVNKLKLTALRDVTYRSLISLAMRELSKMESAFGRQGALVMTAIALAASGRLTADKAPQSGSVFAKVAQRLGRQDNDYETNAVGIPKRIYSKEYMREVRREFIRLADERALDADEPPDSKVRHSLFAKAEMEVRYQWHNDNIETLRSGGHNLVVCSVHADCSERCSKWQGRVYSLDGTTGVTEDGRRKYIPLTTATDVYYTTKAGKTYKNGLFGFNCRHYLYPYKNGMAIPFVSKEKQEQERQITATQRQYEERIRLYKERALFLRGVDSALSATYAKKAKAEYKAYIAYSHANKRAYYPDRVNILF